VSIPQPWVKFESLPNSGGRFVVSPLSRGMGTTLGNALRRVLLSSLGGYAVTLVKLEGVRHEFSTIPNVVEDVFDVLSNIKALVFKGTGSDAISVKLASKKKGKLYARDIKLPAGWEIVNQDSYLLEIVEGGSFEAELTIESGVGYQPADMGAAGREIDAIAVDASFSPILKVNHSVENIRVGKSLDYDSVTLDVWTNGAILAEEAVQQAASLLGDLTALFDSMNQKPKLDLVDTESASGDKVRESALGLTIDDLELSARSSNCLKRAGIETVAELVEKDIADLIQIKNFGKKSADEINEKLKQYGLSLKGVVS
jgi:DNA-directed RNA polymerase subunit alpha